MTRALPMHGMYVAVHGYMCITRALLVQCTHCPRSIWCVVQLRALHPAFTLLDIAMRLQWITIQRLTRA